MDEVQTYTGAEYWINRNMRCIEMTSTPKMKWTTSLINRNMRCIEMISQSMVNDGLYRLIET